MEGKLFGLQNSSADLMEGQAHKVQINIEIQKQHELLLNQTYFFLSLQRQIFKEERLPSHHSAAAEGEARDPRQTGRVDPEGSPLVSDT